MDRALDCGSKGWWFESTRVRMNEERGKKFYHESPVGDVDWVRKLVFEYRDNPEFTKRSFFSHVLLGYYDTMWSHLDGIAGDIIYALSDFVPQEERMGMPIYPSSDGSIALKYGKFDSLEDWRNHWESLRVRRLKNNLPVDPQLPNGTEELGSIFSNPR